MAERRPLFGVGLGAWNGADVGQVAQAVQLAAQAAVRQAVAQA